MSYVKSWQNRLENYADFYTVTGGTLTTALAGEQFTTPVVVYSLSVYGNSAASAAHLQLMNASTTADTPSVTAGNLAFEIFLASGNTTFAQQFGRGLYCPKGLVINFTATAGGVNIAYHKFHAGS